MKNEDVRMNENYSYIATFVFYVMRREARRIYFYYFPSSGLDPGINILIRCWACVLCLSEAKRCLDKPDGGTEYVRHREALVVWQRREK